MNAFGLVTAVFLVGGLVYLIRHMHDCNEPFFDDEYRLAPGTGWQQPAAEEPVDFTNAVLITERGTELRVSGGWDIDDVMNVLAEIDSLEATA